MGGDMTDADNLAELVGLRELVAWLMNHIVDGYWTDGTLGIYDSGCGCCSDKHDLPPHLLPLIKEWYTQP
jgi:hypothetical protein